MAKNQYISINSDICFGKPRITGTRITVSDVLNWLENGMSIKEIMNDFPELNSEQINACIRFGKT